MAEKLVCKGSQSAKTADYIGSKTQRSALKSFFIQ